MNDFLKESDSLKAIIINDGFLKQLEKSIKEMFENTDKGFVFNAPEKYSFSRIKLNLYSLTRDLESLNKTELQRISEVINYNLLEFIPRSAKYELLTLIRLLHKAQSRSLLVNQVKEKSTSELIKSLQSKGPYKIKRIAKNENIYEIEDLVYTTNHILKAGTGEIIKSGNFSVKNSTNFLGENLFKIEAKKYLSKTSISEYIEQNKVLLSNLKYEEIVMNILMHYGLLQNDVMPRKEIGIEKDMQDNKMDVEVDLISDGNSEFFVEHILRLCKHYDIYQKNYSWGKIDGNKVINCTNEYTTIHTGLHKSLYKDNEAVKFIVEDGIGKFKIIITNFGDIIEEFTIADVDSLQQVKEMYPSFDFKDS